MVFPWVDYWIDRHNSQSVQETSGSADLFLMLLKCFKTTFLQDAAVMTDVKPDHPIWKYKLFATPLFQKFRRKVKIYVKRNEEPESSLIARFAPEVQQQLYNLNRTLTDAIKDLTDRQKTSDQAQQQMQQMFNNVISGRQQLQLSVTLNNNGQVSRTSGTVAPSSSSPSRNNANTHDPASSAEQTQAMGENQNIIPTTSVGSSSGSSSTTTETSTAVVSLQYDEKGVPVYKMSRQVATVSDLWDKWSVGRDGNWPVQQLEDEWGTKRRKEDKKWFNIRKRIIDAVVDSKKIWA